MISLIVTLILVWIAALVSVALVLVKRPSRAAGVWAFFTLLTCAAMSFQGWLQFQPPSPLRVKWEEAAIVLVFLTSLGSATGLYFVSGTKSEKGQQE